MKRFSLLCLMLPGLALGQGFDIYLFDISKDFSLTHRVTDRDGYDSQPAFSHDSQQLFFTSDRNGGQFDLFRYKLSDHAILNLTQSPELNEFSAQPYGSDRFSYVLQEGSPYQHAWHRAIAGGDPERLLSSYIPVGYYARNEQGVLFWGRYAYALFFEPAGADVGPGAGESLFVIDQAGRSLHAIPDSSDFSFVHKQSDWSWVIKRFDPKQRSITPLAPISNRNEDYCWHPSGYLITASGKLLLRFDPGSDTQWQEMASLEAPGLGNGGRCAVSPDGRYLALVSDRS